MGIKYYLNMLLILAFLFLMGCGATHIPEYVNLNFKNNPSQTISLLPVIDKRPDKSEEIDFEKHVRNVFKEELEKKGYIVYLPIEFNSEPEITPEIATEMSEKEICKEVKSEGESILLFYVHDILCDSIVIRKDTKIHVACHLMESDGSKCLLRDTFNHSMVAGGLVGMAFDPSIETKLERCVEYFVSGFPDRCD